MYKKVIIILAVFLCFFAANCDPELTPEPSPEPTPAQELQSGIVNITIHENCERLPLGTGASIVLETFQVEKKAADTVFLIEGTISGFGNHAGSMPQGWKYGDGDEVIAQSLMYDENNNSRIFTTTAVIRDHTETGLQIMTFRYFAADGTVGSRPFNVYNPNSIDDARLAQTCSRYIIWEIRL
ncbi:MAG: hypothetical protein JXJ04_15100 [Spirochaetales bacterium]|nr:hypothetical protein [Spirochaetales bacterium]